jgi:hypothetical protein
MDTSICYKRGIKERNTIMKTALDIILENRKKHEKSTDSELLDFAITQIQDEISYKTIQARQEILDAIRTLEYLDDWSSLMGWARHIIDSVEDILEKELKKEPSKPMKNLLKTIQFKKDILQKSNYECRYLLTEDAKQHYFPEEEKCQENQEKTQTK